MRKRLTPSLVVVVLALALASSAFGSAGSGAQLAEAGTISVEKTSSTFTKDGLPCRANTYHVVMRSVLGRRLWAYFQRVRFCYTGYPWIEGLRFGDVRNISRSRWGEVYALGWDYEPMGKSGWCSPDRYDCHRFSQGKFRLCGPFCVQTKTPWIRHDMFGNGRMGVHHGG
jgi:hypothetical protein